MIHYDSSGKLTKSVSKQLFKRDAPAPSCIHRQINTFMCSYLHFLCPANELLTLQLTTLRHRWNNPPPRAWSNLRWTVWSPPSAAGSQLWLSADGHHTFDRCIGSAPSTRTNDKCCKKNDACSWTWLPHEGEKEPLGLRESDHVHLLRSLRGLRLNITDLKWKISCGPAVGAVTHLSSYWSLAGLVSCWGWMVWMKGERATKKGARLTPLGP